MAKGKDFPTLKNLKELNRGQSFGHTLGLRAKPGIQRYGANGQRQLAKAVASGKFRYRGMKVPQSKFLRREADLYLRTTANIRRQTARVVDKKVEAPTLISHHESFGRIKTEIFRHDVERRVRRHVDPNVKLTERALKQRIKQTRDRWERFELRRQLDKFRRDRAKLIKHREIASRGVRIKPLKEETEQFLKDVVTGRMKVKAIGVQTRATDKKMDFLKAKYDGRDIGIAIGSLVEDDLEYDRLIEYLKNARHINAATFWGIVKSPRAKAYIQRKLGRDYGNDVFGQSAQEKMRHTSDRGYTPPTTYQQDKTGYKKGDLGKILKGQLSSDSDRYYNKVKSNLKKKK